VAAPITEPDALAEPVTTPEPIATPIATPDPQEAQDRWGWTEPWVFEVPTAEGPAGRRNRGVSEASPAASRRRRGRNWRRRPVVSVAVILVAAAVSVWVAVPRSSPASARSGETAYISASPHPSAYALRTIPAAYLHDYWKAADEYGLDWTKLAAVGQIESDQGRSETPGVTEGTNTQGAAGPAQFLGSTWARYGVDADGRGSINPYDPADAITAMAAYLKASGAPQNWSTALYAYNHSDAYVNAVLALGRRYLAS